VRVETPDEAAEVAECHWRTGGRTAVLVCVPVPDEAEIAPLAIESLLEEALTTGARKGLRGKEVTPFLLAEMERLTSGQTVKTNRVLLVNNASEAASIAVSLSR